MTRELKRLYTEIIHLKKSQILDEGFETNIWKSCKDPTTCYTKSEPEKSIIK